IYHFRHFHASPPELGWNIAAYVSHATDSLRNSSERLAGARLSESCSLPGYDQDLLGRARFYNDLALACALWSLERAADAWVDSASAALEAHVVLEHTERGIQRAEDVAHKNARDGAQYAWDIRQILMYVDTAAPPA
ncbi:hypothetical protein AB4Z54_53490, partial [Streptomyces sp. MCAF7]